MTFAGNLAFWGVLWGPLRILHPLWQEKDAFLRLPRSTCASGYKHHKCCVTMLQGRIREGYWESRRVEGTHTRDTGEKDKSVASYLLRVLARFFLSALPGIYRRQIKFDWGQKMACAKSGVVFLKSCTTISVLHSRPQLLLSPNSHRICRVMCLILHLYQTYKHLLKEQKISYPMLVSGHGLVEWVQRYACAKLGETIWLAGG